MTPWRPNTCALTKLEAAEACLDGARMSRRIDCRAPSFAAMSEALARCDAELLRLPGLFQSWLKAQRARS